MLHQDVILWPFLEDLWLILSVHKIKINIIDKRERTQQRFPLIAAHINYI